MRAAALLLGIFLLAAARPDVTVLQNGHRLVVVRPEAAQLAGVVLLVPGGSTLIPRAPALGGMSQNFVIRTRELVLAAGYAVAYMDDPRDLSEAIARLRTIARPVVILSTSRGTIVAARNAARLGTEGPDLLVLTSPVTVSRRLDSLADVDLHAISIPTLIVANTGDTCVVSPPAGAAALVSRLAGKTGFVEVSSSRIRSEPCEALSPHGYLGIESEVIVKILDWINQR